MYLEGSTPLLSLIYCQNHAKLPTYSVDFIDNDYSEGFKQKLVHSKLKTNHNTLMVNDDQIGVTSGLSHK